MPSETTNIKTYIAVALTAVITAIVSIIINEPIYTYLNRAQPHISVTSIGFAGPIGNESILIPSDVVRETSNSNWLESLKNYEQFEKIIDYDKKLSVDIIRLDKSIKTISNWQTVLEDKLAASDSERLALNERELIGNEITKNELVATTILRKIHLERTASPPLDLKQLEKFTTLISVKHDSKKKKWSMQFGISNISIPYSNLTSDKENKVQIFARTLARGSVKNLSFYTQLFIDTARARILEAQGVQEKLRSAVYPVSRLVVNATLHNEGKSSVTFKPYFGMKILHQSYSDRAFYLALDASEEARENPFSLTSGGFSIAVPNGKAKGKEVEVKSFIPEAGIIKYVSIPPESIREVSMVGTDPLGESAEDINNILKTKSLTLKLLGISSDEKEIWSDTFIFSEGISKEIQSKIDGYFAQSDSEI